MDIGNVVKVTITEVNEFGALCSFGEGQRGMVTYGHYGGKVPTPGQVLDALVLYIDLKDLCVEFSLDSNHIKHVKKFVDSKFSQV